MTLKIPFNRFVTFIKPYLNVGAAGAAAWLATKANTIGIPYVGEHKHGLATGLAAAAVGVVTWAGSQLGDVKWLKGHHIELEAAQAPGLPIDVHTGPEDGVVDHAAEDVPSGALPSDQEEQQAPPPLDAS